MSIKSHLSRLLAGALVVAGLLGRLQPACAEGGDKVGPFNGDYAIIGDSITYMVGGSDSASSMGIAGGPFNAKWQEVFGGLKGLNFGISGDVVEGVLWRLNHGLFDGFRPKVAIIKVGTNNTGAVANGGLPPKAIAEGIALCAKAIRYHSPKTKVIVVHILPRNRPDNGAYDVVKKVNAELDMLKLSESDPGIQVINLWDCFTNPNDGHASLLTNLYLSDTLHLTPDGIGAYANGLWPYVKPILENPDATPVCKSPRPQIEYAPYHEGKMEPQKEGWPLTKEEADYIEFKRYKPGKEPEAPAKVDRRYQCITPMPRGYRGVKGFNPYVEIMQKNMIDEMRALTGQTKGFEPKADLNPVPKKDEKVFITQNQVLGVGVVAVSPNGQYTLVVKKSGEMSIESNNRSEGWSTGTLQKETEVVRLFLQSTGNLILAREHKGSGNWGLWASQTYQGGEPGSYYATLTDKGTIRVYKGVSPGGDLIGETGGVSSPL